MATASTLKQGVSNLLLPSLDVKTRIRGEFRRDVGRYKWLIVSTEKEWLVSTYVTRP